MRGFFWGFSVAEPMHHPWKAPLLRHIQRHDPHRSGWWRLWPVGIQSLWHSLESCERHGSWVHEVDSVQSDHSVVRVQEEQGRRSVWSVLDLQKLQGCPRLWWHPLWKLPSLYPCHLGTNSVPRNVEVYFIDTSTTLPFPVLCSEDECTLVVSRLLIALGFLFQDF